MARKKTVKSETTDLAQPQNRTEEFLAKIAGLGDTLPQGEFSRLERYLKYIAENGGGGGGGGVTSFNMRTGAVTPESGDYTPEQVGAAPAVEDTTYAGCYKRTVGGVTEWINPPFVEGQEYRTTERWLGKPVYGKALEGKTINVNGQTQWAHSITNFGTLIRVDGYCWLGSGNSFLLGCIEGLYEMNAGSTNLNIKTNSSFRADMLGYPVIYYTKSTD